MEVENGRNYCLCCGNRAESYGWASVGTDGTKSCSKEVCVSCLESGCPDCYGSKLAQTPYEWHERCEHPPTRLKEAIRTTGRNLPTT
jgi:hypothetical protein